MQLLLTRLSRSTIFYWLDSDKRHIVFLRLAAAMRRDRRQNFFMR